MEGKGIDTRCGLSTCCIKMSLAAAAARDLMPGRAHMLMKGGGKKMQRVQTSSYRMTHFPTLEQEHERNSE